MLSPAAASTRSGSGADAGAAGDGASDALTTDDQLARKSDMLDKLSAERPLAKAKKALEEADASAAAAPVTTEGAGEGAGAEVQAPADGVRDATGERDARSTTPEAAPPPPSKRRPLFRTDDREMERVSKILKHVHRLFYAAYDARPQVDSDADSDELPMGCDVELIIPDLKSQVLRGCHIVFTGVIPHDVKVPAER